MQPTEATPPLTKPHSDPIADIWKRRTSLIWKIGSKLGQEHFPTGDRAALRRYEPSRNTRGETVAIKLLLAEDSGEEELAVKDIRRPVERWTWLLHCMALMSGPGRSPHNDEKDENKKLIPNGKILFEVGFGESRLARLLDARGDSFDDLFARLCRGLSSKGKGLEWSSLVPLIFAENGDKPESARLRIAADYYAAQAKASA